MITLTLNSTLNALRMSVFLEYVIKMHLSSSILNVLRGRLHLVVFVAWHLYTCWNCLRAWTGWSKLDATCCGL